MEENRRRSNKFFREARELISTSPELGQLSLFDKQARARERVKL